MFFIKMPKIFFLFPKNFTNRFGQESTFHSIVTKRYQIHQFREKESKAFLLHFLFIIGYFSLLGCPIFKAFDADFDAISVKAVALKD